MTIGLTIDPVVAAALPGGLCDVAPILIDGDIEDRILAVCSGVFMREQYFTVKTGKVFERSTHQMEHGNDDE